MCNILNQGHSYYNKEMGSCGNTGSKAHVVKPRPIRRISILPSQFISESHDSFGRNYSVVKKLGSGNYINQQ